MKNPLQRLVRPTVPALAIAATSFAFSATLAMAELVTECTGQLDGTACSDGIACTLGDVCRSGYCVAPVSYSRPADIDLTTSQEPYSIAYGDFNGDGHLDLATGSNSNPGKLTILLGDGGGGFSPPFPEAQPVTVGGNPHAIAVGHWDGDGKLDLAIATPGSSSPGTVTILHGDGFGGFGDRSDVPVGNNPRSVVPGDFDGDGNLDLAVPNADSNTVTVLRGDGSGGFPARADFAVGSSPTGVGVGDWNADGKLDLAVSNNASDNLTILLGNGMGAFSQAGSPVATGDSPASLGVGDWNGDGQLDLAVANLLSRNVTVLLGTGSGGFVPPPDTPVAVDASPDSMAVGDLNGDGTLDLALGDGSANSKVLFGSGSGGFALAAGTPIPSTPFPKYVVCGDWNEDGRLDLAVATSGSVTPFVMVLLNNTKPVSLTGSMLGAETSPGAVATGDWNGDGKIDVAAANRGSNNVTIQMGDGAGGFSEAPGSPVAAGLTPASLAVGDYNRDAKLDLAVANERNPGTVTILLGNGVGGFSQAPGSPAAVGGTFPTYVVSADFDRDGKLDLALANIGSGQNDVSILLGNGAGGFAAAPGSPVSVGQTPVSIAVGDVSGDGKLDLAVANGGSDNVTILLGNGAGGFSEALGSPIEVPANVRGVVAGDWNGDAKLDLAVTNSGSAHNDITIFMGNGSGGFTEPSGPPIPISQHNATSIAVGDLNGDGKLDLAVTNTDGSIGTSEVQVFAGNGYGGFSLAADTPAAVGTKPVALAIGNLDGAGFPDIVVANLVSNNLTVLMNNTTYAPDGTACNDGDACTQLDVCHSNACKGAAPVVCVPSDSCHAAACNPTTGLCSESPAPAPSDVGDGLRVWKGAVDTLIGWNPAAGSNSSSILIGLVSQLPVGSGSGGETCLENDLPYRTWTTASDPTSPAPGSGRWYLVRGVNACAPGTYGYATSGAERIPSVACP